MYATIHTIAQQTAPSNATMLALFALTTALSMILVLTARPRG